MFRKSLFQKSWPAILILLVTTLLALPTQAQTPSLTLTPADATAGHAFGTQIEAAGNLLLVSAPGDTSGIGTGALYVFERDALTFNWQRVLKITPQQQGETLGAFATDGSTFAYVIQPSTLFPGPSVNVWQKNSKGDWWQTASLEAIGGAQLHGLAVDGDDLVVVSDIVGNTSLLQSFPDGGVWQPLVTGASLSNTHAHIDLHGNVLVAGNSFARRSAPQGLFPNPADIPPPGRVPVFGDAVAISDDGRTLAMGVSLDGLDGSRSGSVYLYDIESGDPSPIARLSPSDAQAERRFGAAVDFDGNRLAVSAPGALDLGVAPQTYMFEAQADGGFVEARRLDAGDPALALAGDAAFVGAPSSGNGGVVLAYALDAAVVPPSVHLAPVGECSQSSLLTVSGNVTGSEPITRITSSVNGDPEQDVCLGCGTDPAFRASAQLLTCQDNTVTIRAEDALGQSGSASLSVYVDEDDPVISGCRDQSITIPADQVFADADTPDASDGCELVSFECTNETSYGWPRFPVGADQPASCVAVDRCGREARCTFTVTVDQAAAPPAGKIIIDFRDLADGPPPGDLTTAVVGEGSGSAEIRDSMLEMTHTAEGDNADRKSFITVTRDIVIQKVPQTFRVETSAPEPDPESGEGEAGLTLSIGEDGDAPVEKTELRVVRDSKRAVASLLVRHADTAENEEVEAEIPISDATTFSISVDHSGKVTMGVKTEGIVVERSLTLSLDSSVLSNPKFDAGVLALSRTTPLLGDLSTGAQTSSPTKSRAKSQAPAKFTFESLTIETVDFEEPTPTVCQTDDFNDGTVDPAWTLTGVGNANYHVATEVDGELQLTANGSTAFYGADNAGFLYREVTGDFRVETTIDGNPMTHGGKFRKAGLMVRQSLDPWNVRLLALLVPYWYNTDETHLQFAARQIYGAPGYHPVAKDVVGVPRVVRLAVVREGQTLSVEYSLDGGFSWIRPRSGLGGSVTLDGLAPTLLVGLGMVSNNVSELTTAHFDDVSICQP